MFHKLTIKELNKCLRELQFELEFDMLKSLNETGWLLGLEWDIKLIIKQKRTGVKPKPITFNITDFSIGDNTSDESVSNNIKAKVNFSQVHSEATMKYLKKMKTIWEERNNG